MDDNSGIRVKVPVPYDSRFISITEDISIEYDPNKVDESEVARLANKMLVDAHESQERARKKEARNRRQREARMLEAASVADASRRSDEVNFFVNGRNSSCGYKIKKSSSLRRAATHFAEREGKGAEFLVLLFRDNLVRESDTPLSLGIEDGDEIIAYEMVQ